MKLYLQNETSKLKVVGRKENGNLVLEIVKDKLGNLVGQLTTHSQEIVVGWILSGHCRLVVDYETHEYWPFDYELSGFLDKLS